MKAVTSIDDPRYVKAMSHPLRVLGSDPKRAVEAGLGVLLFEAARRPAPTSKRVRKRGSAPAAGSVAAGAGTEG